MNASVFCNYSQVDFIMNKVELGIYIPTFILGCILNIFALLIFFCFIKKWTEASIYLINLAILDLFLILSLPFKMYFSEQKQIVDNQLCTFAHILYFTNMYGSIYMITCISLDRYIAIKHPFWAKHIRSPKKTTAICFSIWIFVWAVGASTLRKDDQSGCFHNMSTKIWSPPLIICLELFGFLIPMIILMGCSFQIVRELGARRGVSEQDDGQRTTVRSIIISNLVVFLLSFLPSHVGIFLQFLVKQEIITDCYQKQTISLLLQLSLCLANVNPCLDAVCYYFVFKEFRELSVRSHSIIWRTITLQPTGSE
ncbi:G-protein coupled receptor 55 [Xenopus laevis]|uniref:G-protein coupled receptors family 1 profile domain-containing protein n=2 Tax=Xenopus laevis TaxID=8355 RepID=A0A974CU67_XENLA|nr:G-protein coupled receptor 55 [Xenopus laevis]OCT78837.1 hypothetical protein XELAEV_18029927mg [Xenopus laevis]